MSGFIRVLLLGLGSALLFGAGAFLASTPLTGGSLLLTVLICVLGFALLPIHGG